VHLGTARFEAGAYADSMQLRSIQVFIALMWVLIVTIAALAGDVNSVFHWTILAAVALFPSCVMMRWWSDPRRSISQTIQEALR